MPGEGVVNLVTEIFGGLAGTSTGHTFSVTSNLKGYSSNLRSDDVSPVAALAWLHVGT
jgi:hypothetical protein